MICYRSVPRNFGTKEQIFQGVGALTGGGRWNPRGVSTVYCSKSIDVAASERAFHSLSRNIESYNEKVQGTANFTSSYYDDIVRQKFSLAEVELGFASDLLDLTSEDALSRCLTELGLAQATLHQARLSDYMIALPQPAWTRVLGERLSVKGIKGLLVPSARSDKAHNVVIFDSNVDESMFSIRNIVDISISAISIKDGKILRKGHLASISEVEFASTLGSGKTKILYL